MKILIYVIFFLLSLFQNCGVFAQIKWQTHELVNGGRIDALTDLGEGVIVLGTRGANPGNIFRSEDYGLSWKRVRVLDEPKNAYHNNEVLGLMSDKAGNAYLITSNAWFWRSVDNGLTWHRTAHLTGDSDKFAYSYSICITQQGTILVTSGKSVYRSIDEGKTFERVGPISEYYLYRLQLVGDIVFVNGWGGTLYRSEDDGMTWSYFKRLGPVSDVHSKDIMKSQPFLTGIDFMSENSFIQGTMMGDNFILNTINPKILTHSKIEGSIDDYVYLGHNVVLGSTFTETKSTYISFNGGIDWEDVGKVPTKIDGDWLDHVIKVDRRDSVIMIGGTNKGFVLRSAISLDDIKQRQSQKSQLSSESN